MLPLLKLILGLTPLNLGVVAGAVAAGMASSVVGGMMADDNGATGANDAAAASTRMQAQIAQDQWAKYKEIYEPLERTVVADAQASDTPAKYAQAAGDASATVAQQFGKTRARLGRTPGLDMSSPAYAAGLADLDRTQAAADATQQNAARQKVTDTAWARKTDALGLGKGLPAQSSSMLASNARTNAGLAEFGYARADKEAAGIGKLVSTGLDAWSRRPSTPSMGDFGGSGGFDTVGLSGTGDFGF
jgi:hypothetical protein